MRSPLRLIRGNMQNTRTLPSDFLRRSLSYDRFSGKKVRLAGELRPFSAVWRLFS